jgi:DNA-binding CsgD family transcriptional regulator
MAPRTYPADEAAAALHALGLVALASGEAPRAARLLEEAVSRAGGAASEAAVSRRLPPDLIEALGRLGAVTSLRTMAAELRDHARRTANPGVLGWAAHASALAAGAEGDLQTALDELELSLRCAERVGDPFELGRVLTTLGQAERRLRRKYAARAALEHGAQLFASCGAESWAVRARDELARVSSGRRQRRGALTVTERRVCEQAAAGCSNAEIGADLFISRRTVEVNLARAYAKLGIRGRAQLGAALARDGGTPAASPQDMARAVHSVLAVLDHGRRQAESADSSWAAAS